MDVSVCQDKCIFFGTCMHGCAWFLVRSADVCFGESVIWAGYVFQSSDKEKQVWQLDVSSRALGSKTKRR